MNKKKLIEQILGITRTRPPYFSIPRLLGIGAAAGLGTGYVASKTLGTDPYLTSAVTTAASIPIAAAVLPALRQKAIARHILHAQKTVSGKPLPPLKDAVKYRTEAGSFIDNLKSHIPKAKIQHFGATAAGLGEKDIDIMIELKTKSSHKALRNWLKTPELKKRHFVINYDAHTGLSDRQHIFTGFKSKSGYPVDVIFKPPASYKVTSKATEIMGRWPESQKKQLRAMKDALKENLPAYQEFKLRNIYAPAYGSRLSTSSYYSPGERKLLTGATIGAPASLASIGFIRKRNAEN